MELLDGFLEATSEKKTDVARFDSESSRMVRIDVDGSVWLKPGAAIALRGEIAFERLATLEADSLEEVMFREAAPLVRARGNGRLYCACNGSPLRVVRLSGDAIFVAWDDLIAFEDSLTFETSLAGHGVGIAAGGLVIVKLSGEGAFAVATHGQPLTLRVEPGRPVCTDPHATVAWSATLTPSLKMDVTWRSAVGHGGSEPVQMQFEGTGFVIVQPFKDRRRVGVSEIKKVAAFVTG